MLSLGARSFIPTHPSRPISLLPRASIRDNPNNMATQAFLEQHGIQAAVESVINATIKAKPESPYAFMASSRDFSDGALDMRSETGATQAVSR
jgi:hypothetical protein